MGQEAIVEILKEARKEGVEGLTIDEIWARMLKEMDEEISRVSVNNSLVSMLKYHEVVRVQFKTERSWREFKWMLSK